MKLRTFLPVFVLVAAASLGACSSDDSSTATTPAATDGTGAQVIAPVIVDAATVDGTTVQVQLGNVVVVNADDPATWTGEVADTSIATFTPGSDDGSATFNPGVQPLHEGTTTVTMTDGTTTISFTLEITP